MSRTGSRDGFSLLEVLVASVILTLGAVFLFPAFFLASDALVIAQDRLQIQSWADNKLWEDAQLLEQIGPHVVSSDVGEVALGKRIYSWERDVQELDPGLFAVTLTLRWRAAGKQHEAVYLTYAPACP